MEKRIGVPQGSAPAITLARFNDIIADSIVCLFSPLENFFRWPIGRNPKDSATYKSYKVAMIVAAPGFSIALASIPAIALSPKPKLMFQNWDIVINPHRKILVLKNDIRIGMSNEMNDKG